MEKHKCTKCNIVKELTLKYFVKTSIKNIKKETKSGNPYCKLCQKEMRKKLKCKHGKRKYRCIEYGVYL
tara:strand:- start:84 stop:290 length:207 start_codon:yes stop_codon:yes gene_type:complete